MLSPTTSLSSFLHRLKGHIAFNGRRWFGVGLSSLPSAAVVGERKKRRINRRLQTRKKEEGEISFPSFSAGGKGEEGRRANLWSVSVPPPSFLHPSFDCEGGEEIYGAGGGGADCWTFGGLREGGVGGDGQNIEKEEEEEDSRCLFPLFLRLSFYLRP